MTNKEILSYSFGQYVKRRFSELLKQGVNGEKAYTTAVAEYVKAAMAETKQK